MAVTKSAVRNQQVTKALQSLRKKIKNRGKKRRGSKGCREKEGRKGGEGGIHQWEEEI